MKKDAIFHEHLSLAIAGWAIGLPVTITHTERQQLHDEVVKALDHIGAFEKPE